MNQPIERESHSAFRFPPLHPTIFSGDTMNSKQRRSPLKEHNNKSISSKPSSLIASFFRQILWQFTQRLERCVHYWSARSWAPFVSTYFVYFVVPLFLKLLFVPLFLCFLFLCFLVCLLCVLVFRLLCFFSCFLMCFWFLCFFVSCFFVS